MQSGIGQLQNEAAHGLKQSQKWHLFKKEPKRLHDAESCLDKLVHMAAEQNHDDMRALLQMGQRVRDRGGEPNAQPKQQLAALRMVLTSVQSASVAGFGALAGLAARLYATAGATDNLARGLYEVAANRAVDEPDRNFVRFVSHLRDAGADPRFLLAAAATSGRDLAHYAMAGRQSAAPSGAVLAGLVESGLDPDTTTRFIQPLQAWQQPLSETARGKLDALAVERLTQGPANEADLRQLALSALPQLPDADRAALAGHVLDEQAANPPSEGAQRWLALRADLEARLAGHPGLPTMRAQLLAQALGQEPPQARVLAEIGESVAAAAGNDVTQQLAALRAFADLAAQQGGDALAPYFTTVVAALPELPSDGARALYMRAALLGGALRSTTEEASLPSQQQTARQWPALVDQAPVSERASLAQHLLALGASRSRRDGREAQAIFYENLAPALAVPMVSDEARLALTRQMLAAACTPAPDLATMGNHVAGMGDQLGQPLDSRAFYLQAARALWLAAQSQNDELGMARLSMIEHMASRPFPTTTAQPRALRAGMTMLAPVANQVEAVTLSVFGATMVNSGYGMGYADYVQAYGSVARSLDMWGTAHGDDNMREQARMMDSLLGSSLPLELRSGTGSSWIQQLSRGTAVTQTLPQFTASVAAGINDNGAKEAIYRAGLDAMDRQAQQNGQPMMRAQIDFLRGVLELPIDASKNTSMACALASPTLGSTAPTAVAQLAAAQFGNYTWTPAVRLGIGAEALRTMSQQPNLSAPARDVLVTLRTLCRAEFYNRDQQASLVSYMLNDLTPGLIQDPGRFADLGARLMNVCSVPADQALVARSVLGGIDRLVGHGGEALPGVAAVRQTAREAVASGDVSRMKASLEAWKPFTGSAYQPA